MDRLAIYHARNVVLSRKSSLKLQTCTSAQSPKPRHAHMYAPRVFSRFLRDSPEPICLRLYTASFTPAMPSDAQRQLPWFTTCRLSYVSDQDEEVDSDGEPVPKPGPGRKRTIMRRVDGSSVPRSINQISHTHTPDKIPHHRRP